MPSKQNPSTGERLARLESRITAMEEHLKTLNEETGEFRETLSNGFKEINQTLTSLLVAEGKLEAQMKLVWALLVPIFLSLLGVVLQLWHK